MKLDLVNDTVLFPGGCFNGDGDRYSNFCVPGTLSTGVQTTKLTTPQDIEDFFYQYFWVIKNVYGFNGVRAGGQDHWGLDRQHQTYIQDPEWFFRCLNACLDGASANDCYLLFEFGGMADVSDAGYALRSFDRKTGEFRQFQTVVTMEGHLFLRGSEAYDHYFKEYIPDVMNEIGDHEALIGVELLNEPDSDVYAKNFWSQYGGRSPTGPRMTKYRDFVHYAGKDVHSRSSKCMISMGHACEGLMFSPDWENWGDASQSEGQWCIRPNDSEYLGFSQYHKYFSMTGGMDDPGNASKGFWYYAKINEYLKSLGKPYMLSEWGYTSPVGGLYNTYRQEYKDWIDSLGFPANGAMRVAGKPGFPFTNVASIPHRPTTPVPDPSPEPDPSLDPYTLRCPDGTVITLAVWDQEGQKWDFANETCPAVQEKKGIPPLLKISGIVLGTAMVIYLVK